MPGAKKRASEGDAPATRSSKAAKSDTSTSASKAAAKKGAKAAIPASEFKVQALPLHVNITHTPPTIPDDKTVPSAPADPGFLGAVTLVPSSFATGSYGWKGSKRITVELQNPEEGAEKEKVQVMLTINATVVGSKNSHDGEEGGGEEKGQEPAAEDAGPSDSA